MYARAKSFYEASIALFHVAYCQILKCASIRRARVISLSRFGLILRQNLNALTQLQGELPDAKMQMCCFVLDSLNKSLN